VTSDFPGTTFRRHFGHSFHPDDAGAAQSLSENRLRRHHHSPLIEASPTPNAIFITDAAVAVRP